MTVTQSINAAVGRVPPWLLYGLAVISPVWLFYLGLTGGLGVEPIKALEHEMGELSLQLLILTLKGITSILAF